jgi:hypothetical protein
VIDVLTTRVSALSALGIRISMTTNVNLFVRLELMAKTMSKYCNFHCVRI